MESILWSEESDAYTNRAIELHGESNLYSHDSDLAQFFKSNLSYFSQTPSRFIDIGCAYGAAIHALLDVFPESFFIGIDPGEKSISIAKSNIKSNKVRFEISHSHSLPIENNSIDVVILRMVMQWLPRNKLFPSIAEIDRVLKTGGIIFIQDFLPNRPVTSISRHNEKVFIFKESYTDYFIAAPWYIEIFRQIDNIDEGEDQQRCTSLIRKYSLDEVYLLKKGATVNR